MNKKGFTLVELLMVVIIIGILVTLAVPNYYKSIERTKGAKAKGNLKTIRDAETLYRNLHDTYTTSLVDLSEQDLPTDLQNADDGDWTYGVTGDASTLTVTASRKLGPYPGLTITLDQDAVYTPDAGAPEWQ